MKFQLIKIFLWPKNGSSYREVEFTPGAVNVICGSSKAGKSAVIPIIDYCLAAEKCAIPVGTIRDTCAWFGLLVDTREGQKLFARAEPGNQRSTDDMFILEGQRISVPERIAKKNTNCASVKDILNRLAGLPNIGFDSSVTYGFRSRPSFRDLMAFTFQPQNIVANPDVLFYKSDTTKHRDKLRDIFPFILGAVTSETLIATWEMKDLERQQKQLQSELKALFDASARLRSEARSWFFQAREYGLAPLDAVLSEDWEVAIEQLKAILAMSSRDAAPKLDTVQKTIRTIGELKQREDIIAKNLYIGRQKLKELEQVKQDADAYLLSLDTISERLSLSSWLKDLVGEGRQDGASVLGTHLSASTELDQLCLALTNIESLAQQTPVVSTSVENELVRLRNAMRKDLEELEAIRTELRAIETLDKKAKGEALRQSDIDRYLGRLEEAVKNYTSALVDDGISKKLEAVNKKIKELAPKISVDSVRANTRRVLDTLSDYCAEITPELDAEWKNARIALSITDLAIKVRHNGRDDYLWEVGSGANWLAYHVAMLLALQKFFMKKSLEQPVPHFLVFDQPSQVYFPVKRAAKESEEQEHEWGDEDRTAVRKVFTALAAAVKESQGELQVIVLDHADEGVWGNIPGVVLTEEWRDKKLVPPSFE